MNAQEMIDFVRLLIKEPEADHYKNADILALLNEGISKVADKLEAKETSVNVNVLAGASSVSLPSNLLRLKAARIGAVDLPVVEAKTIQGKSDTWETDAGTPTNIIPQGLLAVRPYPLPDSPCTITFDYIQAPAALADAPSSVPELPIYAHYVPCKWAAYRLLLMDKAPEAQALLAEYQADLAIAEREAASRRLHEDITIEAVR